MKKFTMNLSEEIHKELKHYCVDHDTDMAEVIRRLIEEFLRKLRQKK